MSGTRNKVQKPDYFSSIYDMIDYITVNAKQMHNVDGLSVSNTKK